MLLGECVCCVCEYDKCNSPVQDTLLIQGSCFRFATGASSAKVPTSYPEDGNVRM